ncbi:MAG: peroxidase-related enzyme [Chloroflexota bacterium]|nr:peroxidase-related enzyme [Chloroflexota bacterium]
MSAGTRDTFTLDFLEWSPWLERAVETDISPEQRERVNSAIGDAPNSDYIAVLANDFEAWQARALVHRHVYTSEEPEPTSWRELGATTTSRINGCVFCASVHARIYANLSKKRDLIQRFLDDGIDTNLPPVERAIVDLSAKLTTDPESVAAEDLEPLRALGFDDLGILDVINYAAFFANANRLMLTLGEPRLQRKSAA